MIQRKPFSVRTLTAADAVATLPDTVDFDGHADPIDVYILASGFEERVLAIPAALNNAGSRVRGVILLGQYRTNVEDNAQRESELRPILNSFEAGEPITFDADSPESTFSSIKAAIESQPDNPHVVFDISGASSTLILSAMASLLQSNRKIRLTILYATAEKYHEPSEAALQEPIIRWGTEDHSEVGVSEVEVNELYPGRHHDNLPSFVIALPSTAPARMRRCLGKLGIEPLSGTEDRVHWILPRTDNDEHKWRQGAVKRAVLDIVYGESRTKDFGREGSESQQELPEGCIEYNDVGNYRQCVRALIERIDEKAGHNISLIHLGTKLQGVAVALAMAARAEVALVNARPKSFQAKTYSEGSGRLFAILIDDPIGVVRHLSCVGTLRVETA